MKSKKPARSFRIDPDLLELAKKRELNLTQFFEAKLRELLKNNAKCPLCGQKIKNSK